VFGNSGKPVTLETLSLTKFLRYVFQEQGIHDFRESGTCEASDRKHAKFGDLGSEKTRSHEHAEARNLELAVARTSKGG
jgi:hypothetical protein